jgi:hypothetical protein
MQESIVPVVGQIRNSMLRLGSAQLLLSWHKVGESKGGAMFADEKRQVFLIVGAGLSVMVLIAAAVILLDVRSLVQNNTPQIESAINEAIEESMPIRQPMIDEAGNYIFEDEFTMPRGVDMRGPLQRGQTVSGSVGMYHMEGWSLDAQKGEQYLLDFEQLEGGYYWQMTVYDPQREMLAFTADSEAGYADYTQLLVDIPADGRYVVVLSGFGESDGDYTLAVY